MSFNRVSAGAMFAFIVLGVGSAFCQVTVREKVTLSTVHEHTTTDVHKLRFFFSREAGLITQQTYWPYQKLTNIMRIRNVACGVDESVNVDAGSGTIEVSALSGGWYTIDVGMNTVTAGAAYLEIDLDGLLIRSFEDDRNAPPLGYYASGTWENGVFLFSGYNFSMQPTITPCDIGTVTMQPYYQNCSTDIFDISTDPIIMRIIRGKEYAAFIDADDNRVDSIAVWTSEGKTDRIDLRATGVYPPPGTDFDSVIVEITTTFTHFIAATAIGSSPPHALAFWSVPINLISFNSAPLTVLELDSESNERQCDDNRLITLCLDPNPYGHLIDTNEQQVQGYSFTGLYKDYRKGRIKFYADGQVPDSVVTIGLTATTPGAIGSIDTITLNHPPDTVLISVCPHSASPGDTVSIMVRRKTWDCEILDYSDDQRFYVDFCNYDDYTFGAFLDPLTSTTGSYLWCARPPFQFITSRDTLPSDPDHKISFTIEPLSEDMCQQITCAERKFHLDQSSHIEMAGYSSSTKDPNVARDSTIAQFRKGRQEKLRSHAERKEKPPLKDRVCEGDENLNIASRSILLGETKYYYASICNEGPQPRLIIGETKDWPVQPAVITPNWDVKNIFPTDKLATYYEFLDPDGDPLPAGWIRLIGRYWEEGDQHFSVELSASVPGEPAVGSTSITVSVTKPGSLGLTNSTSLDVWNNPISIDDSCIVYGGRYGIPPQFIKGQIEEEAQLASFGFAPTYLYEPYTVQFDPRVTDRVNGMVSNPYVVTDQTMGMPAVPNHLNVFVRPYWMNPVTVWDVVEGLSELVYSPSPLHYRLYGKRVNGRMDFGNYLTIQSKYDSVLNEVKSEYGFANVADDELSDSLLDQARVCFAEFLRTSWRGGLSNVSAQTRIAASYGLLQPLYVNIIAQWKEVDYHEDVYCLPEGIDESDIGIRVGLEHQSFLLSKFLGNEHDHADCNWIAGFEKTLRASVYRIWHPGMGHRGKSYSTEVAENSVAYSPFVRIGASAIVRRRR
ncbi:MAG TPA: hypothetical protein VLY03_04190 [Bacteroidota bacterium]|nr:hypothetical protein [Bacteroidota bacterium]